MQFGEIIQQLRKRRVIRATVIYVALLWVVLQAADLFANAEIISDAAVRWTILLGVIGIPVVVASSWFLESPWKKRRWTSVGGDLIIIVAITLASLLFAWQQWFASFSRPIVAVLPIEATDTREDTQQLADHLNMKARNVARLEQYWIEHTT